MKTVKIGIIGMGHISDIYCENLQTVHENTEVAACADVNLEAAAKRAEKWNIPDVLRVDELLDREDIEIVINLTPPEFHFDVIKSCLLKGKHVYTEKPLAMCTEDAKTLVSMAEERGLMLASAPETNYGAAASTAKDRIEKGEIGKILYADARFLWPGDEYWHPNPSFLFQPGAGPLFDRGPYFLNMLVDILGKAREVFGMTGIGFPTRVVTSEPRRGEIITVNTPTHVEGLIRFENEVIATTTLSFDIKGRRESAIEIYGTEGSILIQDPVNFVGPAMRIKKEKDSVYEELPYVNNLSYNIRGYAVAEMAKCLREGSDNYPAKATRALHVVEIAEKLLESAEKGVLCKIETTP